MTEISNCLCVVTYQSSENWKIYENKSTAFLYRKCHHNLKANSPWTHFLIRAHTHGEHASSCCGETSRIPACAFNFVYNNAPMQKAYQKLFKLGLMKTESLHFFSALNFALLTYLSAIGNFWKKCFKNFYILSTRGHGQLCFFRHKFAIFCQTAYGGN